MSKQYGTYLERLNKGYKIADNGCWEWQGKLTEKGYARFLYKGIRTYAHRVSYLLFIGEINDSKMQVCHQCDNPKCCSPFHLFLGTNKENQEDSYNKGRQKRAEHGSPGMYGNNGCRCELCMEGMRNGATKYRNKNTAKLKEYHREYKAKNTESLKAKQNEYIEKNKEHIKIKAAENYQKRKTLLGIPDKPILRHGTYTMYSNKNCRCDLCLVAGREYNEKLRERLGDKLKEYKRLHKQKQKSLKQQNKNLDL